MVATLLGAAPSHWINDGYKIVDNKYLDAHGLSELRLYVLVLITTIYVKSAVPQPEWEEKIRASRQPV